MGREMSQWVSMGKASELKKKPLQEVVVDGKVLAPRFKSSSGESPEA